MLKDRPLLHRSLIAALGVISFSLLAFVGLGWVVWKQSRLLGIVMSFERIHRLQEVYRKTVAALLPTDSDGDGVCDGNELFLGTDPRNPLDHWPLNLEREVDDIIVNADTESLAGISARDVLLLSPGEKFPIRVRMKGILNYQYYPVGFRFQITPSSHLLLASPGGTLSTNPMVMPGPEDRVLAFDLEVAPDTMPAHGTQPTVSTGVVIAPVNEKVTITNLATKEVLYELQVWCAWKLPPLATTLELMPPPEDIAVAGLRAVQLHWPAPAGQPDALVVEAARDSVGAEWFPVHIVPPEATKVGMEQQLGEWCYGGALKYRVVPIRYFPP